MVLRHGVLANWLVECFSLVVPNMVLTKFEYSEACFTAHKGPLHVSTLMGFCLYSSSIELYLSILSL